MNLIYTDGFSRAYRKLPAAVRRQVDTQLLLLCANPHHPSLRTHKRRGEGEIWQARIPRSYRLFYLRQGESITLLTVGPHEK